MALSGPNARRMEAAIKRLPATEKRKLVGTTVTAACKLVLDAQGAQIIAHANAADEAIDMSRKDPSFAERLLTAVEAKRTQVEKMRAMALTKDAQSAERQTARVEVAEARNIRTAAKKSLKRVAAGAKAAERAAEISQQARAILEEKTRKEAARVAQGEADAALTQTKKAARDRKYAARKARQK
jgi:hypothetical protein